MEIKNEVGNSADEDIFLSDVLSDSSEENRNEENKCSIEVKKGEDVPRKRYARENSFRRGLLPHKKDKSSLSALNLSVVKRCCVEHCYFVRNQRKRKSEFGNSFGNNCSNTLPFQNEKEILEQQTIDIKCLASKAVNSVSINNFVIKNRVVNDTKKRNSVCSSSSSDTEESVADDINDNDYCPEENSSSTDSEDASDVSYESCDSVKKTRSKSQSAVPKSNLKNCKHVPDSGDRKKTSSRNRLGISSFPTINRIPNNFVSVHDLLAKIRNMQKLMKSKCDKKIVSESQKIAKIPPPKLKKMMSRKKEEDFHKISDYLFPMPNLTKMGTEEKNWKVEYMNDDVQSLGLDDLLLKASELNAENFTKALGRKLDLPKANFNKKDKSEIVFTIPKSKRNYGYASGQNCENVESEFSKSSNLKTIKLDISKPFFEAEKVSEPDAVQESSKAPEEVSPKRPGIKVKTVENINEEFKDSLGLKRFTDCSGNAVDKNVNSVSETSRKKASSNHVSSLSNPITDPMVLDKVELDGNSQDREQDQSRPFIMTIIESKTEKQRPAILRNSSYFKKKTSIESEKNSEKAAEAMVADRFQTEASPSVGGGGEDNNTLEDIADPVSNSQFSKSKDFEKNGSFNGMNWLSQGEIFNRNTFLGKGYGGGNGSYSKILNEAEEGVKDADGGESKLGAKRRNIPFILNHSRKARNFDRSVPVNCAPNKGQLISVQSKMVKVNEGSEKSLQNEKSFKVTSIEQKLGPKETNRRFIKVVPYEAGKKPGKKLDSVQLENPQEKHSEEEESERRSPPRDEKGGHALSLSAFSAILKDILPDKWFLILDKKYGLQIIKTHVDDLLNPSMLISVVIARCGKLTVNVRGKQLEKSHELFSNICDIGNSENKISLNYILAILNKLRHLSVCFGCDDPSLKKYWRDDGFVEHQTESQQVYRSHLCHLLVSLGKKRCYPCYRMNESLKKRHRRDRLGERLKEEAEVKEFHVKEVSKEVEEPAEETAKNRLQSRGVKRNLEDFLEESFSTMKQQIVDEIEKNKTLGERENALKAQEEVLSFMGLARKDSLDNSVRKSKRKKNTFYKLQQQQQPVKKKIDQHELEFLEKYWTDINTLFSTSLLFGAYSRTGRGRLREKCRMFEKLLSTWRDIVRSNPEWIGGEITLPDYQVPDGVEPLRKDSGMDHFDKMEVPGLRAYIINSVKEVNRIKHKLKTRNSYFKILYNKFVKRRMKRPKQLGSAPEKKGTASSANSTTNTPEPTDFSSDDSIRDKEKAAESENHPTNDLIMSCGSEGDSKEEKRGGLERS